MPIRYKLLLAFSVVLALAAGVAIYGISAISQAGSLVVRLYDGSFMATSYARAAQASFNDARAAMERALRQREAVSTPNLARLESAFRELAENLKIVRERMADPVSEVAVKNAQALAQGWYETGLKIIKPATNGLTELPLTTTVVDEADAVSAAIDQIVETATAHGFAFRAEADATVRASKSSLILLTIVTGAMAVVLAIGIAFSFSRPVRSAMAVAERVAGGDLSREIRTKRRDEFGRLLKSLAAMQQALRLQSDQERTVADAKERERAAQLARRQIIEQQVSEFRAGVSQVLQQFGEMTSRMQQTARTLSTVAGQADRQSKDAAAAAKETSGNVEAIAGASEQLGTSVRQIAARVASASGVVGQAAEMARGANDTMAGLAEAATRIDDVVNLIRAIAGQTNLLALNATIEAARAGDAGRGFSVVASEVKALAAQTAKATEEISNQISGVQAGTGRAVTAIGAISSIMTEINGFASTISAAVNQQGSATDEIARNIQDAATGTQSVSRNVTGTAGWIAETNRSASEVLDAAEKLTSHADALQMSINRFLGNVSAA